MRSIKIAYFPWSLPLSVHLRPKFFRNLDLGRPILNELPLSNKLWNSNLTVHVNKRIQNKSKTNHVTFKLITRSIVRFSPQTMQ